jgi:hypothetical protein
MGYDINPKMISQRVNGLRRYQLHDRTKTVVAFSDVGFDAIRWTVLAYSPGQTTTVLDYGKEPARGFLVPRNCSELESQKRIYAGLKLVHSKLDAIPISIRAWGIDRGFKPEVVHGYAKNIKSRFPIMPVKGYGASQYRPDGRHVVGEPGDHCHITESELGQYLAVHADYWRETTQRAFLADPLAPGSCSLWGKSLVAHWEFAEHVCSEQLADKAIGPRGVTFWRWTRRPGAQNHWLDTLVGCYALLAWFRMFTGSAPAQGNTTGSAPRRYRENRKCKVTIEN